ncbi:MAG: class I SAM-dependent methyltransferase [PVC group bacterium]
MKWGMDPAREMLELARARGVSVVQGHGESLPFAAGVCDCVLLIFTLCFVPAPERLIDEARRVLGKGGSVIVGIIDKESFLGEIYETRKSQSKFYGSARFFSVPEVLNLLPENRWRDIEIFQTIFNSPEEIAEVQIPKNGYGEGGFVVIRATKS